MTARPRSNSVSTEDCNGGAAAYRTSGRANSLTKPHLRRQACNPAVPVAAGSPSMSRANRTTYGAFKIVRRGGPAVALAAGAMSSPAANDHPEAPLFSDGLGERVVAADGATGELLQILRLRPTLTAVPSFEFALRERVARLANFRHAYYVRVRRVDRGMGAASSLAVVSDHVEGTRLSDILRVAHERRLQIDINAALCLIRQLVPAVSVLHENARDVAHGLISPQRLVGTPEPPPGVVEHVVGAAIEALPDR